MLTVGNSTGAYSYMNSYTGKRADRMAHTDYR